MQLLKATDSKSIWPQFIWSYQPQPIHIFFSQLLKSVDCAAAEYDQDTHHHLDSSQVPVFPESAQKNVLKEAMSKCHPYGKNLGGTMPSVPAVEGAYSDN